MTTLIINGTPSAVVPSSSNVCIEEEIGFRRYDDFTESSEIYGALIAVADPDLVGAVIEMRAALAGMMRHSCVADADPRDKDAEDHAAESAALRALSRITIQETTDGG